MFDLFVAESNNNLEIKSVPGICLYTPKLLLHELEVGYELQYKVGKIDFVAPKKHDIRKISLKVHPTVK